MRNTTVTIVRVIILPLGSISENCPVPVLEIIISFIKTENCELCGSRSQHAKPTDKCQLSTILNRGSQRLQDPRCLLDEEGWIQNWFVLIIICFPSKLLLSPSESSQSSSSDGSVAGDWNPSSESSSFSSGGGAFGKGDAFEDGLTRGGGCTGGAALG